MESIVDPVLSDKLRALAPSGVRIAHRVITPGDENLLFSSEMPGFQKFVLKARRQSGAARVVARELLETFGFKDAALPRSKSGAAIWPWGVVGSLAHDDFVAVSAVASARQFVSLGIDVEPAAPLPPEVIPLVTTAAELSRYSAGVIESRLLFSTKEAVYKALNPTDGVFLDFHDIEIDLDAQTARTTRGRCTKIAFVSTPRIIGLAYL